MSHESIVYGFIQGATFTAEAFRRYQVLNLDVIQTLPEEDEFPFLARGMFSAPEPNQRKGTFRAQVIHFGGSINGLDFDTVEPWIHKFETLLTKLYWFHAAAHILTDYIDGVYSFQWEIHDEIAETYRSGNPSPTVRWHRIDRHAPRQNFRYVVLEELALGRCLPLSLLLIETWMNSAVHLDGLPRYGQVKSIPSH